MTPEHPMTSWVQTVLRRRSCHLSWPSYHTWLAPLEAELWPIKYVKVTLDLPVIIHLKAFMHHAAEKSIEEISVVWEFSDVFLDDLPGIPPERDIEFKIELQPGIAPAAKSPYKMIRDELAEFKIQRKDLLNKAYILPSSSPWGCPALFVKKKD
jgi:hypothetical protein